MYIVLVQHFYFQSTNQPAQPNTKNPNMARLSGLASDHHPQGPGDAPRRKKGRKSQTPSVDFTNGTKRAASPAAEASTKRAKRVFVDDHDQLERELEESVSRSQASDTINVDQQKPRGHRRRHSEPLAARDDNQQGKQAEDTVPSATQPLNGATRISKSSRRARMSMPAQLHLTNVDETDGEKVLQFASLSAALDDRVKRRLRRNHLSEEVNEIEAHKKEDAKLKKAYLELRRQLRDKEDTIADLEYQLEARRLGDIDMSEDQTEELKQQLEQARLQIEELRASSVYAPDSRETTEFASGDNFDDDDDGLMLVDPDELNLSQADMEAQPLTNGVYASRTLESSQITIESLTSLSQTTRDVLAEASQSDPGTIPDRISDQAVKRFEAEIEDLTRQLSESQGALRVLTLELQNLTILAPGANVDTILLELRHVLEDAREKYGKVFPNSHISPTNAAFLKQIMDDLEGLSAELLEKTVVAEKQNQRIKVIQSQYESTLGLLADSETRNDDLLRKEKDLITSNAKMEVDISELEDRLENAQQLAENQDSQIQDKDARIHGLQDELEDKDTTLDRLRQALESYRKEVEDLTQTISRLEQEHEDRITQIEQYHTASIQEYQSQLDAETEARATAEDDAQQKSEYIEELEGRIGSLDSQFDEYKTKVTELRQRLAEETQARETAEGERDEHADVIYQHRNTIENLNETVDELGRQISTFRDNLSSEQTQRERTEEGLEEANEKIEALNTQVHDQGVQANELRSKLWQTQQEKDQIIADLKDEARARDQEHEGLLGTETQRRRDAEEEIATLDAKLAGLEQDIVDMENALADMTRAREVLETERDEQVAKLNRQIKDLEAKYTALEARTASTIDGLESTITDLTNEINHLRSNVRELEDAATAAAQRHVDEIEDRDATIDNLEQRLITAQNENADLAKENKSLAKRVENEAGELLNIMSSHAEEANSLREVIKTQEAHIADLTTTAEQHATEHAEAIETLSQELEERRMVGEARAEHIVELEAQLEDIKERFRIQAEDSQATIDALLETNRQAIAKQEELAAATRKRTEDALKAVAEMKVKGLEVKTKNVDLKKVTNGKVTKVNERVKITKKKAGASRKSTRVRETAYRDSGIGFEIDEDEAELVLADEGVVG